MPDPAAGAARISPMSSPVIMWFRQDLRLADHAALCAAASAGPLICLYILDDETPGDWRMGAASRWWLRKSLEKLSAQVPVVLRKGAADRVIAQVLGESQAKSVYFTRDYAPWAAALEGRVKEVCEMAGAACHRHGGYLLHEPESIRNGQGQPYKVYTPFSRACSAIGPPKPPRPVPAFTLWQGELASAALDLPENPDWANGFDWQPGEDGARSRLADFIEDDLAHYADGRDVPSRRVTSRLSPHLHFGEISPAQCWHAAQSAAEKAGGLIDRAVEKFLKEVLWREFSYHLLHHFPYLPETPFKPEFADYPWADDPAGLKAWQRGQTGYPIVDAGMRELWATGTMHNRVRMIAASFLIKDLLIPWQQGARWFWDTLVDADIASNSASWQWVAGCGADAAPYFRIFNPVLQGEKFDGDGAYVVKWIPELSKLPREFIHRPWEAPEHLLAVVNYPKRIIDHAVARDRALAGLKKIKAA